jgi:hypothetical protein
VGFELNALATSSGLSVEKWRGMVGVFLLAARIDRGSLLIPALKVNSFEGG